MDFYSVVEFWISEDGDNFTLAESVTNTFPDNEYGSFTQDYKTNIGVKHLIYSLKRKIMALIMIGT